MSAQNSTEMRFTVSCENRADLDFQVRRRVRQFAGADAYLYSAQVDPLVETMSGDTQIYEAQVVVQLGRAAADSSQPRTSKQEGQQ